METKSKIEMPVAETSYQKAESFKEYFPEAKFTKVGIMDVPDNVVELMISRSEMFVSPEDSQPLIDFYSVEYKNGDISYISTHIKQYRYPDIVDKMLYVVDSRHGDLMGYADVSFQIEGENTCDEQPFILFIRTNDEFRRQGIGKRRLLTINVLSKMFFDSPIYSGGPITDKMRSIWEKMADNDEAIRIQNDDSIRYRCV